MKVPDIEIQVHLGCFSYHKYKEAPLIEIRHYEKATIHERVTTSNEIFVVLNGILSYSCLQIVNRQAVAGSCAVLPAKSNFKIEIKENTTLVIFRLDTNLSFCDHHSFEMLHKEKSKIKNGDDVLQANPVIIDYLNLLTTILNDGLYCGYLLEIKLKEFLYLLRYYYPQEELKTFFAPILSDDFEFSRLVRKVYKPHLNVGDLAKQTNYSIAGFGRRFKKVFDVPPAQWIQEQKAQVIYHEINCSTKTFAELAYEFGFSSPAHFTSFCKKVFHDTPKNIRSSCNLKEII